MYAIVKTGGKQYTVSTGDEIVVEKLAAEVGSKVELPVVTLVEGSAVITEAAELAAAKVTAEVIEQFKGEKQLVFKFKKRKNYKRLNGHRQQLTRLSILSVAATAAAADAEIKKGEADKKAAAEAAAEAKAEAKAAAEVRAAAEAEAAAEKAAAEAEAAAKAAEEAQAQAEVAVEAEDVSEIEAPEAVDQVEDASADLESMTVAQLKEFAAEKQISLKGVTKKADIIAAIRG